MTTADELTTEWQDHKRHFALSLFTGDRLPGIISHNLTQLIEMPPYDAVLTSQPIYKYPFIWISGLEKGKLPLLALNTMAISILSPIQSSYRSIWKPENF